MDKPRIYVGTYGKYNSGSIAGAWLNLEDYANREDFLAACQELHKNEYDPEIMFQDYEGFPYVWYSESDIPAELWEWLEHDEHERQIIAAYIEVVGEGADVKSAIDHYHGTFDSVEDYYDHYVETCGVLDQVPDHLRFYFDVKEFGRCELAPSIFEARVDNQSLIFWSE
tara:strand:- start:41 stop:547 length:507 start_codon:yes stop_codon:yes gene_type:complete